MVSPYNRFLQRFVFIVLSVKTEILSSAFSAISLNHFSAEFFSYLVRKTQYILIPFPKYLEAVKQKYMNISIVNM